MNEPGGWIVVKNWDKFQHRDVLRSEETVPAWIKVYTKLLHNPDYESLTMTQRGLLTTIWLEYGASDGLLSLRRISAAIAQIPGQRLRSDTLDSLIHAGFISVVAGRPGKQSASLEKRREEKNPPNPPSSETAAPSPNGKVFICPHDRLEFKSQARLDEHLHVVHPGSRP